MGEVDDLQHAEDGKKPDRDDEQDGRSRDDIEEKEHAIPVSTMSDHCQIRHEASARLIGRWNGSG